MIIKWSVHNFGIRPTRKEFVRETEHFYVNGNGRRDSKNLRYERYFDTEAEALEFIAEMAANGLVQERSTGSSCMLLSCLRRSKR